MTLKLSPSKEDVPSQLLILEYLGYVHGAREILLWGLFPSPRLLTLGF